MCVFKNIASSRSLSKFMFFLGIFFGNGKFNVDLPANHANEVNDLFSGRTKTRKKKEFNITDDLLNCVDCSISPCSALCINTLPLKQKPHQILSFTSRISNLYPSYCQRLLCRFDAKSTLIRQELFLLLARFSPPAQHKSSHQTAINF